MLEGIAVFFLGTATIWGSCCFFINLHEYSCFNRERYARGNYLKQVRLTYKQLQTFYYVSPDKWEMSKTYLAYQHSDKQIYHITMSFFQFLKYSRNWRKFYEQRYFEEFAEAIQEDIEKKQAESERHLQEAIYKNLHLTKKIIESE